ncbi:MAG: O-antigen ligase family protein [Deltaproteobacteria bacterium]|nr:O-antigen ligase family protein [Deltaproteobacteria bacterium]
MTTEPVPARPAPPFTRLLALVLPALPCAAPAALAAVLLAWGAVRSAMIGPDIVLLRLAVIAGGALAAALSLRGSVLLVVFAAPLAPALTRHWLELPGVSVGQHLLAGVLAVGCLRLLFDSRRRSRSPVDAPLALLAALVVLGFARVALDYQAHGIDFAQAFSAPFSWYWRHDLAAFGRDTYRVLHHSLLILEGILFYRLASSPAAGITLRQVTTTLACSALVVCVVALLQVWLQFAPSPFHLEIQPLLFRLSSTLGGPNNLGAFLVLVTPAIVALMLTERHRLLALGSTLLAVTVLTLSVSRSSWVGLAVAASASAGLLLWRPGLVGWNPATELLRGLRRVAVTLAFAALLLPVTITTLNLGNDIHYRRAEGPADMLVYTLNFRRHPRALLPARIEHWQAALRIWERYPLLGAGPGRYPLMKLTPPGGTLSRGAGGRQASIRTNGSGKFERWINADGEVDFAAADVLPGDTIESPSGGWGPIKITGRWSPTRLVVAVPPPGPSTGLDFVVRHPDTVYTTRSHAHRAIHRKLPMWTGAHNYYLKMLSELGLVGLAVFAWLLVATGRACALAQRAAPRTERGLVLGTATGLLALAVASLAQDPLDVPELQYCWQALVAAVVANAGMQR